MIPRRLKKGDTIGIIAPSDAIQKDDLQAINNSVLLLEASGFTIQFGENVFANELGYGSSAKNKARDINKMFANHEINAILWAKGGCNCNATFDEIDYEIIKQNPKIICGFSDSTSLLNVIYQKTGLITFHGPTFKSLTTWETEYSYQELMKRLVDGKIELGTNDDVYQTIQEGAEEGEIVGGNLSLFSRLICGKYQVDVTDKILLIEDFGLESPPSMISNYFYYMKQNGVFDKIKGIWIGNYEHESGISMEKVLIDTLQGEYTFPIIKSNNFGHTERKTVIPIGTKAIIDTKQNAKIQLVEKCVE